MLVSLYVTLPLCYNGGAKKEAEMANTTTFVKIDRNIMNWSWYTHPYMIKVFLHIIITANIKDKLFEGIPTKRGEVLMNYQRLADSVGLSLKQVRAAIDKLKSTGEITVSKRGKYSFITVINYDKYQGVSTGYSTTFWAEEGQESGRQKAGVGQTTDSSWADKGQRLNNYNKYNNKNNYNKEQDSNNSFDPNEFFNIAVRRTRERARLGREE